ncbi:protein downstream neighbor of Son-like [Asterias rubens]|uniref:protein downstream neighbor of Son-like n=1 Tax=Asterias rubens TaxID=7604 RepID=UPI001455C1D9|nr:protein downstream neighbor of Son-like [Asterias rubens]XP_033635785.1 protein downstream neighbor of Son-like [Asterias rubens]XP_033635786.1 protein downstream neighbor of Son-like [Asterias rubens]
MADQTNVANSPAWKKPSDIMKVRLKKQRASSVDSFQALKNKTVPRNRFSSSEDERNNRHGKRRNPFGQDGAPPARRRVSQKSIDDEKVIEQESEPGLKRGDSREEESGTEGVSLFQALDSENTKSVFSEETHKQDTAEYQEALRVDSSVETEKRNEKSNTDEQTESNLCTSEFLPLDWSIKSRVRFTSPCPFSWSAPLKTTEEAQGLCSFVRCEDRRGHQNSKSENVREAHSQWKARLQQSVMMWSHPHLPWMKLFPRIVLRSKVTTNSFAASDESIQKELMASWSESLRSVFYLLRSGDCPYFYLLAHQYTVLFRAAGVGGIKHLHALFTPTTKGLREAFKEEGIEFSMPLLKMDAQQEKSTVQDLEDEYKDTDKQSSSVEGEKLDTTKLGDTALDKLPKADDEDQDVDDDELEISQDDGAASSWLQSMGLDKQSFPTLEPSKVNFQRDNLMKVDNRPQSTVLIQSSDTQALYNFLLNTKTTVATTGSTAGVPPTILAPVAFQGSTLNSHKWRPNVMKQAVGNTLKESYSLEVTGPLLPHNVFNICQLLQESQSGDFGGNFSSHEPTLPFSQVFQNSEENLENMKRESDTFSNFLAVKGEDRYVSVVKELNCEAGMYQWL